MHLLTLLHVPVVDHHGCLVTYTIILCCLLQNLEKTPLEEVPAEPAELLDRNRYQRSSRDLVRFTDGF